MSLHTWDSEADRREHDWDQTKDTLRREAVINYVFRGFKSGECHKLRHI